MLNLRNKSSTLQQRRRTVHVLMHAMLFSYFRRLFPTLT